MSKPEELRVDMPLYVKFGDHPYMDAKVAWELQAALEAMINAPIGNLTFAHDMAREALAKVKAA